jgi:hypothetical protein
MKIRTEVRLAGTYNLAVFDVKKGIPRSFVSIKGSEV